MDVSYEKLLDRAYKVLEERGTEEERFKIPDIDAIIQGKKTIIKNFAVVAKTLKRDVQHLSKHFIKESGVPAAFDGQKLIMNGVFNNFKINAMYKRYIDDFVICKQCNKPDTKIIHEKGVTVLKCEACGAITPVRKI